MANRRWAIVAGLGVVELWIVGLMIRSVAGGGAQFPPPPAPPRIEIPSPPPPSTFGSVGGTGRAIVQTIETGSAPHVVIDDDDAVLDVTVKAGASVVVNAVNRRTGWFRGDDTPLRIEKTSDGVRIARQSGGLVFEVGSLSRRLDVVVPPQTRLEVLNAGEMTVAGLRAAATLHTDNGSITVNDHVGELTAKTDNGRILLQNVDATNLELLADNGRLKLDRVRADAATVTTDNGRIDITRSLLRGGKIQTDSGRISLGIDPQSNVTVSAHTSSGKVNAESPLRVIAGADADAPSTVRVGNGAGSLDVGTDNGSITIVAGGA